MSGKYDETLLKFDMLSRAIGKTSVVIRWFLCEVYKALNLNKRVAHLARCGRTYRIRKKNLHRMQKLLRRKLKEQNNG